MPTHQETFARISAQKDGPVKKFQMIKAFGAALQKCGHDPRMFSCATLEQKISDLLADQTREETK